MNWFDKWFIKKSKWAWENSQDVSSNRPVAVGKVSSVDDDINSRSSVNFRFHTAQGGTVAHVTWYDSKRDRYESDLYIISDEKDLGQEISSIIMQHHLRNG